MYIYIYIHTNQEGDKEEEEVLRLKDQVCMCTHNNIIYVTYR